MVDHGRYSVRCFGPLEVRAPDKAPVRFRDRKAASLFAYLICHPDRPHTREALAARFWPDSADRAARNSLNTALSSLRKALGPEGAHLLHADTRSVCAAATAFVSDRTDFERRAAAGLRDDADTVLLAEAVTVGGGEFLEGDFEDWAGDERDRLRERRRDCLRTLCHRQERAGDLPAALKTARIWADGAPLDADAHAALIRLHVADGDPGAARHQWQRAAALWHREGLGAPPEALRRLIERLAPADGAIRLPPLRLKTPPGGLWGRDPILARLSPLMTPDASPRTLTLTGSGGVGKTRLAATLAQRALPAWRSRIVHLSLASLHDPGRLGDLLRENLGLTTPVATALGDIPLLLLIDDCHHLPSPDLAVALQALLTDLPCLRLLVASRHRIGIDGEVEVPLPPLATRDAQRLFAERLAAARPLSAPPVDEHLTAGWFRCAGGNPLALEIAAAQCAQEAPVPGSAADTDLAGVVAAAVGRLSPGLRAFLARLTVFNGGGTTEACAAVCAELVGAFDSAELLTLLRLQALVTLDSDGPGHRFGMEDGVRSVAAALLTPQEADAARQRHCAWYLRLVEEAAGHLGGADEGRWVRRLRAESRNIDLALDQSQRDDPTDAHPRLCLGLARFWAQTARNHTGLQRFGDACAAVAALSPTPRHAELWFWKGLFHAQVHDLDGADDAYARSLELCRALGDRRGEAHLLRRQASLRSAWRTYARARLTDSLALCEAERDDVGASSVHQSLGGLCLETGHPEEAEAHYREALRRQPDPPPIRGRAMILSTLGDCLREQERWAEADVVYRECESLFQSIDDTWGIASARNDRARLALAQDDLVTAERLARETCALVDGTELESCLPYYLQTRGIVAHTRGDLEGARRLFDAAAGLHRRYAAHNVAGIVDSYRGVLAIDRGDATAARELLCAALPAVRTIGECRRQLLCLTGFVRLWAADGRDDDASALVAALDQLLPPFRHILTRVHRAPYDRVAAALRRPLPSRSLDEAIVFALRREGVAIDPLPLEFC